MSQIHSMFSAAPEPAAPVASEPPPQVAAIDLVQKILDGIPAERLAAARAARRNRGADPGGYRLPDTGPSELVQLARVLEAAQTEPQPAGHGKRPLKEQS